MANIDVKYEAWKNKLLDLGKRNRLLNYKDTARSNVKIEYPECGALYNMFVICLENMKLFSRYRIEK